MTPAAVPAPPPSGFQGLDWLVLGLYFVGLAATGYLFSRRGAKNTDDYFLGGRSMPTWAVAISVLATSLSAATFVGGPQQAFAGDLTYLSSNIGMLIAAIIVATLFVPAFYRHNVSTIYALLETRFGPGAQRAASAMFMLGRVFASGARIYIVALPAALILFGDAPGHTVPSEQLVLAIAALTVVGIAYTLVGGVSAVIWTDVVQTGVFLLAVGGAIALLLYRIPIGPTEIADTLAAANEGTTGAAGKLTLLRLDADPAVPYTLWTAIFAFTLMGIASYGADQDLAQRLLTCKSAAKGSWSIISAILLSIPVVMLFMLCGLLLWIFYRQPQVMGDAAPAYAIDDSRTVFLNFILREMPAGMSGLMMAGLFAAGLSSLNSALNAMGSTFINDFYKPLRPGRAPKHYVIAGRVSVAAWGVVLGGFACFCVFWQRAEGTT
ncbi:MAG: sodium/solute symporter, partial [Planctomycetota bacterium]